MCPPALFLSPSAGHASGDASLAALAIATRRQGRLRHGEPGAQRPRRGQCLSLYGCRLLLSCCCCCRCCCLVGLQRNLTRQLSMERSYHTTESFNLTARAESDRTALPKHNCLLQRTDICQHESGEGHEGAGPTQQRQARNKADPGEAQRRRCTKSRSPDKPTPTCKTC